MKKSKDQGTPTVAQDKACREKLDLVKEKSLSIEKALSGFEIGKNRSNFILSCFKKLLATFPTTPAKDGSVEELREWPGLSSLKEADQPMTQEEMEKLWQSIEEYIETCDIADTEYTFIDFEKGTFVPVGSTVCFLDATIEIAPVSNDPLKGAHESFDLRANNHLRGAVYLVDQWDKDQPMRGLLKAVDEDGKFFFVELKHFSMMTHTLTCHASNRPAQSVFRLRVGDKPNKEAAPEDEAKSDVVSAPEESAKTIEPDMFILFNKPQQAFWSTLF